jgi:hypothetical protein
MLDPANPGWPSYGIGPHDSVFALGVASVNYARLEFAFGGVFGNVVGLTNTETWEKLPKIRNSERVARIRKALSERDWPQEAKQQIDHFIDAFKILVDSRNLLMHSNITSGVRDTIALYKYDFFGKTILAEVKPEELRRVADDMMTYFDYGLRLANVIAFKLLSGGAAGMEQLGLKVETPLLDVWPEKPPLPVKLDYRSRP